MSLWEIEKCSRKDGGCGHPRHRHTRGGGSAITAMQHGGCRAVNSEGRCPCPRFVEREEDTHE
jgi:hypothetical protein